MSTLDQELRAAFAADAPPTPDIRSLVRGAKAQAAVIRRRRAAIAAVAFAAIAGAVTLAVHGALPSSRSEPVRQPRVVLPQPGGVPQTVYRFTTMHGPARVVSFLDTKGQWCLATWESDITKSIAHYQCVPAELTPSTEGFGRVGTNYGAPWYDGVNMWMQGVASSDVARITVSATDGTTHQAKIQREAAGVVFYAELSSLQTPAFYRAYDSRGHLVERLRVPQRLPGDKLGWGAP